MHNLYRSGTSALQSVEGRSKGGDDVGNGICKSGGVPNGGVSDGSIPDRGAKMYVDGAKALIMAIDTLVCGSTIGGGSGSVWEVDGDSALNRIIAALYPNG
ncbi:hypothetical protein Tco_1434175 [Tanacetum coccineum]